MEGFRFLYRSTGRRIISQERNRHRPYRNRSGEIVNGQHFSGIEYPGGMNVEWKWRVCFSTPEVAARAVARLGGKATVFLWQGNGVLCVSPKKEKEAEAMQILFPGA